MREVGHGVCLVEDASCVLAVGGQVVRDHAVCLVMPSYLKDLVQHIIDGLSNLLVRDDVSVVEDAD